MTVTTTTRRTVLLGAGASATALLFGASPASAARSPLAGVVPLEHAHAHNDYEHDRPLWDALEHGFTSVEADIWLDGDDLYVGHDAPDMSRTLRDLYLEPLDQLTKQGRGSIFPGRRRPVQLLVDVKSGGEAAREVLYRQLSRYPRTFTSWVNGRRRDRAVTVVLSGELAQTTDHRTIRWAGADARFGADMPADAREQLPLVSANWIGNFAWLGMGPMPSWERRKLDQWVSDAHARGQRTRFWGTPDLPLPSRERLWATLLDAGVDHLNTDDLAGLQKFLLARGA